MLDYLQVSETSLNNTFRVYTPPPKQTISQWADAHRILSAESSAEPGRWRTSRTPYMREPMDEVTNPDCEDVVFMSSSQVGKTELCLNTMGYFIHRDPAPILLIEPTLDIAEAYSKDRLAPMIRDTPELRALIADVKTRDSGNTILHKRFLGGHITLAGSNSPSGLASRPIRIILFDEVDRYAPSAGSEGSPIAIANKRSTTFWNRKKIYASTPTIKGMSNIEAMYDASDQRQYWVPCWACHTKQLLKFEQIKWDSGNPDTAMYACEHCGAGWSDVQRHEAIIDGEWRARKPFSGIAGFHIWEAYNPWVKLSDIVKNFLAAKERKEQGDLEALKAFVNTTLGQTWEESGERVSTDPLLDRRENYAPDSLPYRILYLTAGIDVQDDRIEVEIVGWRAERRNDPEESWGVEIMILYGDPAKPEIWQELDDILLRVWTTEDGRQLRISATAIDSGGHHTDAVYKFCSQRIARHIYAVKGMAGTRPMWPPKAGKSKKYKGHRVWIVGVDVAKDAIYSRLRIANDGPGYCHFPLSYTREYFEQLTSERVITRYVKGHPVREWHKPMGKRNEALDRRAYALAVLHARVIPWEIFMRGAPTTPPENQGPDTEPLPPVPPQPAAPRPSPRRVRFRIGGR